jgi:2-methylisocitrate lyase-like PEP mutase family enzyme
LALRKSFNVNDLIFQTVEDGSNLAKTFRDLHNPPSLLILPNAWDAGSARIFEDTGAKAIATTSAGVAWALGYPDGNALPVEKLATVVASIRDAIRVPLSVDVEGGYTDEPKKVAEKLKPIIEAGAVGINIEDGEGTPDLLVLKIEQVRKTADSVGVKLFINARTDVYLNDVGTPESRMDETISRAARYRAAGADGIFVPGLCESAAIKAIVPEVKIPVNVMAWPDLPSANELSKLGVCRLSSGQTIPQVLWNHAAELAKKFLETGDSRVVTNGGMGYSKLQSLFVK